MNMIVQIIGLVSFTACCVFNLVEGNRSATVGWFCAMCYAGADLLGTINGVCP